MIQKHKASRLLYSKNCEAEHFIRKISISEAERKKLVKVRDDVRFAIKDSFKKLREHDVHRNSFSHLQSDGSTNDDFEYIAGLTPRFWTQGSFAYQTLNLPAETPPQQIDIDDGVYFPMTFVKEEPKAAKELLFDLVDGVLEKLAHKRGWTLDRSKPTCSRLIINDKVHIDIPIYAIPEERSEHLEEALTSMEAVARNDYQREKIRLNPEEVYLAVRNEKSWLQSDPKKVRDWFENECSLHPKVLRRVCRYLKAWRDNTWKSGGPSSICLMVAAAETFNEELERFAPDDGEVFKTDCQALLAVARRLPDQFKDEIKNPAEPGEVMFPRGQTEEEKEDILEKALRFKSFVEAALCHATTNQEVVDELIEAFGDRIPNKPDWVAPMPIADAVRSQPVQLQEKEPKPPKSQKSA